MGLWKYHALSVLVGIIMLPVLVVGTILITGLGFESAPMTAWQYFIVESVSIITVGLFRRYLDVPATTKYFSTQRSKINLWQYVGFAFGLYVFLKIVSVILMALLPKHITYTYPEHESTLGNAIISAAIVVSVISHDSLFWIWQQRRVVK